MKVAVFANNSPQSVALEMKLRQKFKQRHFQIDDANPEVVVTIGGDGTLLSAFHAYAHLVDSVRFVGVHTGHLGFYTDWQDDEIDDLVISLQSDNGQAVRYPLIDVKVKYAGQAKPVNYLVLNEATLKKMGSTMVCDVYVGGELLEHFRGDGLCVATPTGSTAYNKSVGGAVVHPSLSVMQMTEIASINNRVYRTLDAPMVIAPNDWITFVPQKGSDYVLTVDADMYQKRLIEQITFKMSKHKIAFAKYRHTHFWQRVQTAFISDAHD